MLDRLQKRFADIPPARQQVQSEGKVSVDWWKAKCCITGLVVLTHTQTHTHRSDEAYATSSREAQKRAKTNHLVLPFARTAPSIGMWGSARPED